jgi:hypothetical protein
MQTKKTEKFVETQKSKQEYNNIYLLCRNYKPFTRERAESEGSQHTNRVVKEMVNLRVSVNNAGDSINYYTQLTFDHTSILRKPNQMSLSITSKSISTSLRTTLP